MDFFFSFSSLKRILVPSENLINLLICEDKFSAVTCWLWLLHISFSDSEENISKILSNFPLYNFKCSETQRKLIERFAEKKKWKLESWQEFWGLDWLKRSQILGENIGNFFKEHKRFSFLLLFESSDSAIHTTYIIWTPISI